MLSRGALQSLVLADFREPRLVFFICKTISEEQMRYILWLSSPRSIGNSHIAPKVLEITGEDGLASSFFMMICGASIGGRKYRLPKEATVAPKEAVSRGEDPAAVPGHDEGGKTRTLKSECE